jgi:2-oxoglutarate ferredoxin oxidoreductase subunit beta
VAFALSRLADPTTLERTAIGVLRDVPRPAYNDLMHEQIRAAKQAQGEGDDERLQKLLDGMDTWTVA